MVFDFIATCLCFSLLMRTEMFCWTGFIICIKKWENICFEKYVLKCGRGQRLESQSWSVTTASLRLSENRCWWRRTSQSERRRDADTWIILKFTDDRCFFLIYCPRGDAWEEGQSLFSCLCDSGLSALTAVSTSAPSTHLFLNTKLPSRSTDGFFYRLCFGFFPSYIKTQSLCWWAACLL